MRKRGFFYLFLMICSAVLFTQTIEKTVSAPDFDEKIQKIITFQKKIGSIHPFLENLYPVAIAYEGNFYIHKFNTNKKSFEFIEKTKTPFPIPKGIKAAFPVEGETMCVVTPEIFDTEEGYVFIFHEFIHCHQAAICEQKIKNTLDINKRAMEKQNWSWELNHEFPYTDKKFIGLYTTFMKSMEEGDTAGVKKCRSALEKLLNKTDYEYLVWQEWKEGFARYIENKIRMKIGLKENDSGRDMPFNRITFYAGGESFIQSLISERPDLNTSIEELFAVMMKGGW